MLILPKVVFLFGHRKNHGKDTCCDILEKIMKENGHSLFRTMFAEHLKKSVATKYNLDYSKMNDSDYKNSTFPWIASKKTKLSFGFSFFKLFDYKSKKPRTVRDILIEEGCNSRAIWKHVWAHVTYMDALTADKDVVCISDHRFENEFKYFTKAVDIVKSSNKILSTYEPKIVKILVHRPKGLFQNDGADDQLPDNDTNGTAYWDHIITNDERPDYMNNLETQLKDIVKQYMEIK